MEKEISPPPPPALTPRSNQQRRVRCVCVWNLNMFLIGLARYQSWNHRLLEHIDQVFWNNFGDSVGLAVGRHQPSTLSRAYCHIKVTPLLDCQAILRWDPDFCQFLQRSRIKRQASPCPLNHSEYFPVRSVVSSYCQCQCLLKAIFISVLCLLFCVMFSSWCLGSHGVLHMFTYRPWYHAFAPVGMGKWKVCFLFIII